MSDAANGAGDGGAGNAGAGAGDAGGAGNATPWHGITDATEAAYVANKGWKSPADVIKSYRNAESALGRAPETVIPLPRADDPAGLRAVMQKLGLPESPDKYDFGKPAQGQPAFDEGYLTWAKTTFHELGLPASMAKALVEKNNEFVAQAMKAQAESYLASVTADKATLAKEWGGGAERMFAAAKMAASSLGLNEAVISAIEKEVGYAETYRLLASVGQKLGEDKFVAPGSKGGSGFSDSMTPDEAKAGIEAMKLDPVAVAAMKDKQHPSNKSMTEKWTKLHSIAYPG